MYDCSVAGIYFRVLSLSNSKYSCLTNKWPHQRDIPNERHPNGAAVAVAVAVAVAAAQHNPPGLGSAGKHDVSEGASHGHALALGHGHGALGLGPDDQGVRTCEVERRVQLKAELYSYQSLYQQSSLWVVLR